MFDQSWIDYLNQFAGDMAPMQPMTPPGMSVMPPPGYTPYAPGQGNIGVLPPDMTPPPQMVPPPDITDPSKPAYEASMGGGGLLDKYAMGLGGGSQGGGLLSGLFDGSGSSQPSQGKDWGSMLMALGGGIAANSTQGWGAGLGAGFQGAALANMRSKEQAQEEAYRQQVLNLKKQEMLAGPQGTDDMREFVAAQKDPKFAQFLIDQNRSRGTTVQVGDPKYGQIPPGKMLVMGDDGQAFLKDIPDPKAEADAKKATEAQASGAAEKSDVILGAISGIRDAQKNSQMPVTGTTAQFLTPFSNTGAAAVSGYNDTLKSGIALEKIKEMKAQSATGATGFGALNQEELKLLITDMGSLDQFGSEKVYNETLGRIEKRWKRVKEDAKKNISPERWKELGLDDLFGSQGVGANGGTSSTGVKWSIE